MADTDGPADRFAEVDGARLRFRDEGAGPALLFLHGWALDLDMWEQQAAELSASYRILRFDRRGFGLSSGAPSLERDVGDVAELLDRWQIERVALIGMSQGARVALRAALADPARIACIVLDGPPDQAGPHARTAGDAVPPDGSQASLDRNQVALDRNQVALDGDQIPLDEYRLLAARGDMDGVRRRWSRHPLAQLITDDPSRRKLLRGMVERYPGRDLLQAFPSPEVRPPTQPGKSPGQPVGSVAQSGGRPAGAPALPSGLVALAGRALIVNGMRDLASRRAAGHRLARAIPGARRALVPDAGHLPNLDNSRVYNALLRRFVDPLLGA
jgi:3-oxoadipate enol-lactonase